jgi:hypothetical protein
MRQTNLSVELTLVTPELAANYLRFNNKNRKVSVNHLTFLSNEMKSGRFVENGEAIIFDRNGELKDGQHRLRSIIKSGKSYFIPIVSGVEPISMATYDTGKNRSASDVLSLNGFKYTSHIAKLIANISKFSIEKAKTNISLSGLNRRDKLTNQQILEFCELNYDWLKDIAKSSDSIYSNSNPKTLSMSSLCLISYLIGGENPNREVYNFISHLVGLSRTQGTAANYLYIKLYNSKVNKEPLNFYWVLGMAIKAWNFYADGNPAVKYFKFDVNKELPKAIKYMN